MKIFLFALICCILTACHETRREPRIKQAGTLQLRERPPKLPKSQTPLQSDSKYMDVLINDAPPPKAGCKTELSVTLRTNDVNDTKNKITRLLESQGCRPWDQNKAVPIYPHDTAEILCVISNEKTDIITKEIMREGIIAQYDIRKDESSPKETDILKLYNELNTEFRSIQTDMQDMPAVNAAVTELLAKYSDRIQYNESADSHTLVRIAFQ